LVTTEGGVVLLRISPLNTRDGVWVTPAVTRPGWGHSLGDCEQNVLFVNLDFGLSWVKLPE
jgi:hypothetical protein